VTERRPVPLRAFALCMALAAAGCAAQLNPGDPIPGLTRDQRDAFQRGRVVFDSTFKPETGLGPLFNEVACSECHAGPVGGGFGQEDDVELHVAALRPDGVCDPLVEEGGFVIQRHVTPALKAALGIDSEPVPPSPAATGHRTTPVVFGRGLLDAVSDETILSYADPDDRNHDGISGRVNRFVDGRIGRFGRKALVPTLKEFNDGAFVAEMGITVPSQPTEESIGGQPIPAGVDPTPEPELTAEAAELTNEFVRFLAPPSPAKLSGQAARGRAEFSRVGCVSCHIPTLTTGDSPVQALRHKKFAAFTDLLLHDMGPEMADICLGLALPSEFRTEPLMGVRFLPRFLHDGRATTLEQAIASHGGEAAASRDRYNKLKPDQQAALIAYLKTL
jgi:CxxC motif-containing protein (DUF1111 family)